MNYDFSLTFFIKKKPPSDFDSDEFCFGFVNSGLSIAVSSNGVTILPNKSTLYGNNVNTSSTGTKTPTNNIVPNHGKPYCAPKPPGLKNGLSPLNNINSTNNNGNNGRPNVARSQSVRTPRFVNDLFPTQSTSSTLFEEQNFVFASFFVCLFVADRVHFVVAIKFVSNTYFANFVIVKHLQIANIDCAGSGSPFWYLARCTSDVSTTRFT